MDLLRFTEDLEVRLQTLINEKSEVVADGAAADFVDYKARVAFIHGLKRALSEIREGRRIFMDDDEDES